MIIDVQFNATKVSWPHIRDGARAAEAAGFGAVWAFDHLAGSALGGTTTLEPFTLLGALAASTSTIELGTLVLNVAHRQPAVTAVGAASVEAIAERQVHLGLGAGASPQSRFAAELHAIGQWVEPSLPRRHARVEHVIDVCNTMWAQERDPALTTFPLPRHRPRIHLGVSGPELARLAGFRADGVNVHWHHPRRDELLAVARDARQARAEPAGFTATTWARWDDDLLDAGHPDRQAMAAAGLDRLILVAPPELTPDAIAARRPG